MAFISLKETDDRNSVVATLEQAAESEKLDAETIQQLLEASDFSTFQVEHSGINQLVNAAEQLLSDLPQTEISLPISFIVAKRIDAQLALQLSPDKLSATATIRAAYGGKSVGPEKLKQALAAANIRKGLKTQDINRLLKEANQAKPGTAIQAEIASGKAPIHGKDGQWVADIKTLREQLTAPVKREDGTVDLLDFGEIMTVKEGELLMHLEPPTPGVDGFTVTGEVLPAKPGKEVPFTPAEGVLLNESRDQILAARQGIPVEQPRGIRVDQVYTAAKVDVSTGHITFDGSVIIQGDVEESMKISATGDVTIGGSVYYANIEAGGDIIVRKGVIGRQQDSSKKFDIEQINCHLNAGGHIHISFAQYTHMVAEKNISVDKQLLHCFTQTREMIEIGSGPKDRHGKLIGGITHACKGITGTHFGAEAFIPTEIRMCCNYQELLSLEEQLNGKLKTHQKLLNDMLLLLPKYKALPKTDEQLEKTRRLIQAVKNTKLLVSTLKHKVQQLRILRNKQLSSTRLIARGNIYPNVKVHIADRPYKVTQERSRGGICFKEGEVSYDIELA